MSTSDEQVLRARRHPPDREGPIRSVSLAFQAPEQENGHQPGQNFIVSAVHGAYRVIDDYLKQGEEAARLRQQQPMYESGGHQHGHHGHSNHHHHHSHHHPHHHPHHHHHHHQPMGGEMSAIAWQSWWKMAQSWVDWAMRSVGQGMQMPWMNGWGGAGPSCGGCGNCGNCNSMPSWGGFPWMNAPWMAMQWWWSMMSWWTQVMRMPLSMGMQPPPWGGNCGPHGYPQHHGSYWPQHCGPQQEPSCPPHWPSHPHHHHNHPHNPPHHGHHHHGCDHHRPCDRHNPCNKHKSCERQNPCEKQNPCDYHKQVPQAADHWQDSNHGGHTPPMDHGQNETPLGNIRQSANPSRPAAGRITPIIRTMAAAPTEVHVDLPDPFIGTRTYTVAKFESNDPNETLSPNAVAFAHEDNSLVITVTINPQQHPGVYTGKITDKDTGVAYGVIRITVKPVPTSKKPVS